MKRHGGTLNAYYSVKEANLRKLHTGQFQLHDILENWGDINKTKVCWDWGGEDEQAEHRFLGQ